MTRTRTSQVITLPLVPTPPAHAEVVASAAASPLVASLEQLRTHLRPDGRQLTSCGGISFEPAVACDMVGLADVHLPGTDESIDADPTPRCALLLAVGIDCGAIEEAHNRLVATAGWDGEDPIAKSSAALSTMIRLGPIETAAPQTVPFLQLRDAVLDDNIVHWLATLLPDGRTQTVDHFTNWAADGCREVVACDPFEEDGEFEMWVDNGTCLLIDLLTWGGAIEWSGQELHSTGVQGGARWLAGGEVRLTPLGRHVLPDHFADAGIRPRRTEEPACSSAGALLGDLMIADDAARPSVVASWRADLGPAERARLIAAELVDADQAITRRIGFDALGVLGPAVAEPFVRELLDSPASEDAAEFLVRHNLATTEQMRQFIGYGPLIGLYASLANQPERLRQWFVDLLEKVPEPGLLLHVFALYRTDEATMLLTSAARHVNDPRFAEMIRSAEALHHEVLAEPDTP